MEENKESIEFWKEKEEETGKSIVFKSFVRFLGEKGKEKTDLSGLMYATEDRIYFEDFEKSSMFDFILKRKKSKYEKFTMNFPISEISRLHKVSESSALACIEGDITEGVKPGIFDRLFKSFYWEAVLKTGTAYFFEIFEHKELVKLVNND